ncbi:hypothetical protein IFM89_018249 [Coptis chinensis]|uniref:Uncharacterized protein n=1 Tax=Coptis chinensis TaxID=261450 RepID=A0A835GWV9_9MAGN|nr:hypothetical protein IFM89_018249 [Coptis chinensis]
MGKSSSKGLSEGGFKVFSLKNVLMLSITLNVSLLLNHFGLKDGILQNNVGASVMTTTTTVAQDSSRSCFSNCTVVEEIENGGGGGEKRGRSWLQTPLLILISK